LYVTPKIWSYLRALEDAYYRGHVKLREELRELEEGGIFQKLGILNFLEADYFGWYLDEWDQEVGKAVMSVVDRLVEYDPSTADLEPERIRDLFKRLYQNLVPKKIRHDLGEYYTPDWLAELVLNEVGWTLGNFEKVAEEKENVLAPLDLRLLDPACGSGTFLVLAISRLREYIEEHWIDKKAALARITKNIVGFDLNPLAVIASRINYLISLGDILREKGDQPIEIPVYLADSILAEREQTLIGTAYILRTAVGEFLIPEDVVKRRLLSKILAIIEECVRGNYTTSEFRARLLKEVKLEENETSIIIELYEKMLKLEKEGKNRIWTRILKNSFAPFFVRQFDYVVGNPPWINWSELPNDYRIKTKKLWSRYGLIPKGATLGKAERDMAMLFTYACIDKYLKDEGVLGFLITQTVFKNVAGKGFRKFKIPEGPSFKVSKVHDLVELLPFEGAQNRTAIIFCIKGKETTYPLPYVLWKGPRADQELSLDKVIMMSTQLKLEANPLGTKEGPWATLLPGVYKILKKVIGSSCYRAYIGVHPGLNSIYWVRVLETSADQTVLIENVTESSKRRIKHVKAKIEKEFIYPLLRGRNVSKWLINPELYIILPVDNQGKTIPIKELKVKWCKTYNYFNEFFEHLITRGTEPYKSQLKPWREKTRDVAEEIAPPFYMVFNAHPSLAPYKVVWREQAGSLIAAVVGSLEDSYLEKHIIIPDHKLMFVPCSNEDEAYFICAVLNSSIARLVVKSYTVETQISTHVLEYVKVPIFNPINPLHLRLAQVSKKAHELALKNAREELVKVEEEIDKLVAQLYSLTDEELREIKKCLAVLKGRKVKKKKSSRGR
ncbi:class I SAM-dependent DNA methyltransferase, partial [Archaeoglobales archaeon]